MATITVPAAVEITDYAQNHIELCKTIKADIEAVETGATIAPATTSTPGTMSAADKTKLDAIEGVLIKRQVRISQAIDLAGLGAGVKTFTAPLLTGSDSSLPTNARYVGHSIGEGSFTGFTDGGVGTYTIKVGSASDDDAIVASVNVAAGQTGFPKTGTVGVRAFPLCPLYAETHNAILTSSTDLNTATAGLVNVYLFFQVKA
jgi:hypothetical protein